MLKGGCVDWQWPISSVFVTAPKLTGLQSQDALLPQPHIKLYGHLPNYTRGSSDHKGKSTQTKATTQPGGEKIPDQSQDLLFCLHSMIWHDMRWHKTNFVFLQVMAVDQESGDATFTTVVVDVLSEGQAGKNMVVQSLLMTYEAKTGQNKFFCMSSNTEVPYSALGEEHMTSCTVGKAFFLSMVIMTVLGCVTSLAMWLKRKHKGRKGPLERGCVAQGKHPNVVRFTLSQLHMSWNL